MEAFHLAGIPFNPSVVLDRCKSRVSRSPAAGILPVPSSDTVLTVSAIVADSTLSPISKMREMSSVTSTSLTPLKLLHSQLNEGAYSAQVGVDRAPVPTAGRPN